MSKRFIAVVVATVSSTAGLAFAASVASTPKPAPAAAAPKVTAAPMPVGMPAGGPGATSTETTKAPVLTPEQSQFFESKVRPILAANCYKCHSAEQGKVRGGLTLDTREGWWKGGKNGPAIVPGEPDQSLLIKAIRYADPDLQMPEAGKLPDKDIADLTTWVKMGAPDPRGGGVAKLTGLTDVARSHWAYQPVKKVEVPAVKDAAWAKQPVDAFILAKLEQNGLTPSRPAARETLLRRATYDLTGLPPTPEELHAFVIDRSPDAFEKVVDRLLASTHYGERWGRYWLDTARYADTTGSDEKNAEYRYAYAWTYRDYVIKAFNDDKPYDQFLLEQIAADKLPNADKNPDSLAALGFLTVGKRFQNSNDTIDERIDTVTKATLGLTVSCARCHDHKFDPIPTADYYSLHGIFSSTIEPKEKPLVGHAPYPKLAAEYDREYADLVVKNREIYYKLLDEISGDFRKKATGYVLTSLYSGGPHKDPLKKREAVKEFDLSQAGNGQRQTGANVMRRTDTVFAPLRWFAELPEGKLSEGAGEVLAKIAAASPDKVNPHVAAAFKSVSPASLKTMHNVAEVYGRLFASIDGQAKAYIQANRTAASEKLSGDKVPGPDAAMVQLFEVPIKIEPAPLMNIDHLREVAPKMLLGEGAYSSFAFGELNALTLTHPGAQGRAMCVVDADQPKDSPIFIRGDASQKGKVTPRQFLEILSGAGRKPFTIGSGRLELAQAIADKSNPLTARVMVNRVWMHHFGQGFVSTPDNLGVQSETPSHPELLDYLATRFMNEGWSLKKLHKMVMLTNTYQQSSDTNVAFAKKDPYNRLLWRGNLRRLDFESIRDTMLQFTGRLDRALGGKPVNLTDEPYSYRRSVYGYVDRGNLPELLSEFDYSDPNRPNSQRTTTIVPQQALFFMNSPMSADVARKVCTRQEFLKATNDYDRVRALYEVLYSRQPRPIEVDMAAQFYNAHVIASRQGGHANSAERAAPKPEKVASKAPSMTNGKAAIQNTGETVDRRPLTVWELYAQALLFTNELAYVN